MVIEALSSRPMKRPTWTKTSVTAKATPETVIRKRSLSCSRFLRARSTMSHSRLARAGRAEQRVDHQLGRRSSAGRQSTQSSLHLAICSETTPWMPAQTICATQLGVSSSGRSRPGRDRLGDRPLEEGVGVLLGVAPLDGARPPAGAGCGVMNISR